MEHFEYFTDILRIVEITGVLYFLLIGLYTIGWFSLKQITLSQTENPPKISVVVAARNEAAKINCLLEDLRNQLYSSAYFEVIILDDHSEDKTAELVDQFIQFHRLNNFRLIKVIGEGKKSAIREGISQATGDYIAVTDADCALPETWLTTLSFAIQAPEVKLVLGPVLLHPAQSFFQRLQALEFMSLIGSTGGAAALKWPVMGNGANMIFDRNAALEVEQIRADDQLQSGDDVFLMEAIRRYYGPQSIRFLKHSSAIVTTSPTVDIKSFLKQRMRWVSKNRHYKAAFIIVPATIVFAFNLMLFVLLLLSLFYPFMALVFLLFTGLKLLVDFPILTAAATFFKRRQYLILAVPLSLIYPVYVVVSGFSGLLFNTTWKGRSIKKSR